VNQLGERYLEILRSDRKFVSGRLLIEAERIMAFAAEFDPQPFHLRRDGGAPVVLRRAGPPAAGYTAAVTMRLLTESGLRPAGGYVGAGADGFPAGHDRCAP